MTAILYVMAALTAAVIALAALLGGLTPTVCAILCAAVAVFGLTCVVVWTFAGRKDAEHIRTTQLICRASAGVTVGAVVCSLMLGCVWAYATFAKSMASTYWTDHSLTEVVTHAQSVPTSAETVEAGDLVILYKFGCSDCDAVYDDANALAAEKGVTLKWVSTDTELGRELAEKHGIDWTPTGVYMLNDKIGDTEIIQLRIDKVEDDQTVLDTDALSNLIEYQQKGK